LQGKAATKKPGLNRAIGPWQRLSALPVKMRSLSSHPEGPDPKPLNARGPGGKTYNCYHTKPGHSFGLTTANKGYQQAGKSLNGKDGPKSIIFQKINFENKLRFTQGRQTFDPTGLT